MKQLFQAGNPGGPGRPRGSRNKLSEAFLDALYRDFQINGVAAIADARAESPLGYVRMIASLLPQKLEVERLATTVTDDELLQIIHGETKEAQMMLPAPTVADVSGSA